MKLTRQSFRHPLHETIMAVKLEMAESDMFFLSESDIISVAEDVDSDDRMIPLDAKIQETLIIQRNLIEETL